MTLADVFYAIVSAAGSVVVAVSAAILLSDPETRAAVLSNPRAYWK